jgi:hypothetical protein
MQGLTRSVSVQSYTYRDEMVSSSAREIRPRVLIGRVALGRRGSSLCFHDHPSPGNTGDRPQDQPNASETAKKATFWREDPQGG